MAEAEQALKLINNNGLIGIVIVLLYFFAKSTTPAAGKLWDWFVSWFNPKRADAKEKERQAERDRETRLRREELELMHVYDGELLEAYKKNIEVNTQVAMTMVEMRNELRGNREDLDDIKLDIAGIFAYIGKPQLSRERRNATQPNQALPVQEVKSNARNNQRNR